MAILDIARNGGADGIDAAEKIISVSNIPVVFLIPGGDIKNINNISRAASFPFLNYGQEPWP